MQIPDRSYCHLYKAMLSPVLLLVAFLFLTVMSEKTPQEILIDMGGKQVPLSKINKPHNVVIDHRHKPVINAAEFPDIEPEAKEREVKLQKDRAKKET